MAPSSTATLPVSEMRGTAETAGGLSGEVTLSEVPSPRSSAAMILHRNRSPDTPNRAPFPLHERREGKFERGSSSPGKGRPQRWNNPRGEGRTRLQQIRGRLPAIVELQPVLLLF